MILIVVYSDNRNKPHNQMHSVTIENVFKYISKSEVVTSNLVLTHVVVHLCSSDRPGGAVPVQREGDVSHNDRQQSTGLQAVLRRPWPHGQPGGAVRAGEPGAAAFPNHRTHHQWQAEGFHQPSVGCDGQRPNPGSQRPRYLRSPSLSV